MKSILIEGWRFLPHSYAMVNQFQCLEMLRRPDLKLYFRDMPFVRPDWRQVRGLFDAAQEERLAGLREPGADEPVDAVFRISFPYNFSPSKAPRTAVFGTSEFHAVLKRDIAGSRELREAMQETTCVVITSSNWSKAGFLASGATEERVFVIPLGIDPEIYHPIADEARKTLRKQVKLNDEFVFLHVGAMTPNKNIPFLLEAFARVCERHKHTRLILKGMDMLYNSRQLLETSAKGLTQAQINLIQSRVIYQGGVYSNSAMAELYQLADAYVTPYAAEGFNMPALEAAACGLPLVCTNGGSTDDFTTADFALKIESQITPFFESGYLQKALAVKKESLYHSMLKVIEDADFTAGARRKGPEFITAHFTWKHVVDQLLNILLPERATAP